MELDRQSLFGLYVHSCTHWLRPATPTPPPHLGSYTRALLVSQDRRHLFVTPWLQDRSPLFSVHYTVVLYHRERILETSTLSCNEEEEDITKPPKR